MANYTIDVNFREIREDKGFEGNFAIPNVGDSATKGSFDVLGKASGAFASVAIAKKVAELASEIFQWHISKIGRETGSQIAQDKANALMSVWNAVKNPLDFGINSIFERDQALYNNEMERINVFLKRERGGASLNRSRREE